MTVYFQGSEQEAFIPTGGSDTSGDHDGTWSRLSLSGTKRAHTKVALTNFWVRLNGRNTSVIFGNNHIWFYAYDLAGNQRIRCRGTGNNVWNIEYWNGSTWAASGATGSGFWYAQAECVMHFDLINGVIESWMNGVVQGQATGLDLSAISDLSAVELRQATGNFYNSQVIIADESLLLWNLASAWATANGTDQDGTGDYTNIEESSLNDSDYNNFTAAGEKRSYKVSTSRRNNITHIPKAVTVTARAMRLDDTGPQSIRPYLIIGGVRYYGPVENLTTGWDTYQHTWRQNPATDAAWTLAEVKDVDLEMGWEAVA